LKLLATKSITFSGHIRKKLEVIHVTIKTRKGNVGMNNTEARFRNRFYHGKNNNYYIF
jgi:hypothetical protein